MVPHTVAAAGRNKNSFARPQHGARTFHFKFQPALFHDHTLVCGVNKIKPPLSGRVLPKVATESVTGPGFRDHLRIQRLVLRPAVDLKLNHGQVSPSRSIITERRLGG